MILNCLQYSTLDFESFQILVLLGLDPAVAGS